MRENTRVEMERRRSAKDRACTAEEKLEDERRAAQTSKAKEEAEQAKRNVEEARRNKAEENGVGDRASRYEGVTQGTRGHLRGLFTCPPMQMVHSSLSVSVDLYISASMVTTF